MLVKMEKHALLSEKLITNYTDALQQHGPTTNEELLMVDSESSKFMDEANHVFQLHKTQYSNGIEQKTKEITVNVSHITSKYHC
jgi:hypothetical protein